ncbi:MAG: MBL fold metallo-hydrolase [Ruthenibacterium lactatiformans]
MRMTVYGNNATCPEADGACSCFLIEAEGRRILLDMGNGSLAKLQKDVDLAALDLIAISHLHFDHFGDLFCAKYQLESRRACGEAIPRIPLLTPRLPAWARAELCTNDVFDPHVIEDGLRFRMGDAALEFIGTVHLVESMAFGWRRREGHWPIRATRARVRSLRACRRRGPVFVRGDADEGRVRKRDITCARHGGTLAAENGAKRLLLTHDQTPQAQTVLREARACFERAELTAIGKTWEVD